MNWEKWENYLLNDRSFVLYRQPNSLQTVAIDAPVRIIGTDLLDNLNDAAGFIFHPFSAKSDFIYWFGSECLINGNTDIYNKKTESDCRDTTQSEYNQAFDAVQKVLQSGQSEKIVLSRRIQRSDLAFEQAIAYFRKLEIKYPHAMVFLVNIPGLAVWLGATPEILLCGNSSQMSTMALAGTRWHFPENQHAWTEKEFEEQAIVSRYLEEFFRQNQLEIIEKQNVHTSRAGNLYHLKTTYEVVNRGRSNFLQIACQLHPTPAVCGLPKQIAQKHIQNIEIHRREYYSGFLGIISPKQSALYVNLRSMKLNRQGACLFVGGGITRDSDCQSEWDETANKANTLLSVLTNRN